MAFVCTTLAGCGDNRGHPAPDVDTTFIRIRGSDTMVNVAQIWAEEYKKVAPHVEVEVSGGGSGAGVAALIQGAVDIANASRSMKPEEIEQAKQNTGKTPQKVVVGYGALAIYVHKNNPLREITIGQLADIFGEKGQTTKWSQLGVTLPDAQDKIIRVGRQSNSGTYEFFREHVLDHKDFKLGSREMNGSKDVVELVANTPGAIGYSGMGYNEPDRVRILKVAPRKGGPSMEPNMANTLARRYPIARPLLLYTLGEPAGEIRNYIDWILSGAGQEIVGAVGYVPVPPNAQDHIEPAPQRPPPH